MEAANDTKTIERYVTSPDMLAIGCIHCHKMVFKFSSNLMRIDTGNGSRIVLGSILFECPRCGKTTLLTTNDEIKPGGTVMNRLNDMDCL